MPKPAARFDVESVRASWDDAADVYAEGQASGRDYYRYEFFGPAQLALCGNVREMRVLDVGCGNGYFSREMAGRGAHVTGIDISSRMIARAQAHESAASLLQASRERLRLWDIGDRQVRELEESGTAKRAVVVSSPLAGVVVQRRCAAPVGEHLQGQRIGLARDVVRETPRTFL